MVATEIEVFYAGLRPGNRSVAFARDVLPCDDGTDPGDAVLAAWRRDYPDNARRDDTIIHSCSWHYDVQRHTLVVSYLVLGNGLEVPASKATVVDLEEIAANRPTTPDPLRPQQTDLGAQAVFRHAMRHVPYLIGHNPAVARALGQDAARRDALISVNPSVYEPVAKPARRARIPWPRLWVRKAPPEVVIDTFYAAIDDSGHVTAARRGHRLAAADGDPSDYVRRAFEQTFPDAGDRKDCLLHSTSWHFDRRRNAVVLTYLVYGHELPVAQLGDAVRLPLTAFRRGMNLDALRPQAAALDGLSVLAHGLSHLAYLSGRGGGVGEVLAKDQRRLDALRSLRGVPSGEVSQRGFGKLRRVAPPLVIG